ncbi:unnamed protein product [Amoebophrya sp. A25]|nr:unnamed protein product [Amoebophrya sp. A25]|eukprot:GSA25T00009720001.1
MLEQVEELEHGTAASDRVLDLEHRVETLEGDANVGGTVPKPKTVSAAYHKVYTKILGLQKHITAFKHGGGALQLLNENKLLTEQCETLRRQSCDLQSHVSHMPNQIQDMSSLMKDIVQLPVVALSDVTIPQSLTSMVGGAGPCARTDEGGNVVESSSESLSESS